MDTRGALEVGSERCSRRHPVVLRVHSQRFLLLLLLLLLMLSVSIALAGSQDNKTTMHLSHRMRAVNNATHDISMAFVGQNSNSLTRQKYHLPIPH